MPDRRHPERVIGEQLLDYCRCATHRRRLSPVVLCLGLPMDAIDACFAKVGPGHKPRSAAIGARRAQQQVLNYSLRATEELAQMRRQFATADEPGSVRHGTHSTRRRRRQPGAAKHLAPRTARRDRSSGKPLELTIAWINRRQVALDDSVPRPDFIFADVQSLNDSRPSSHCRQV